MAATTTSEASRLLSAEEVADLLGVPKAWVYRASRESRLPTVRLGRYYRYQLDTIQAWIAEQQS